MKVLSVSNTSPFKLNSSALSFKLQMLQFRIYDTEKQPTKAHGLACEKHFQSLPIMSRMIADTSHE